MNTRGRRADSWTRAALSPPHAHGAPLARAELKAEPEDFRVEEQLSFTPSGEGPHWLLRVEKRSANTRWIAAEIARLAELPVGEVGYAGLKDRHAICVQWFSVPARPRPADFWNSVRTDEFRVLDVQANTRKLKRGALRGNRFRIRLRKVTWSREELDQKLTALRTQGAPNYFGPQRFGPRRIQSRSRVRLDRRRHSAAGPRRARLRALGGACADLQRRARAPRAERRLVAARTRRSREPRRQRQPFSRDRDRR